jgi:hypothetical protein
MFPSSLLEDYGRTGLTSRTGRTGRTGRTSSTASAATAKGREAFGLTGVLKDLRAACLGSPGRLLRTHPRAPGNGRPLPSSWSPGTAPSDVFIVDAGGPHSLAKAHGSTSPHFEPF